MTMSKTFIIFSGFNPRAILTFIRTLERNSVQYAIIARDENDNILLSKYRDRVILIRDTLKLNLALIERYINQVKAAYKSDAYVIAPSTEALNRFLLDKREQLEALGCEVPLVEKNIYEDISDKYEFSCICEQAGIAVPEEYSSVEEAEIPYVAKPRSYETNDGPDSRPVLVLSKKDHKSFIDRNKTGDFYFQHYIDGRSFYLLYYFYKDGSYVTISQENFIQQSGGKSIVAAKSSNHHINKGAESAKYEKLLVEMGYFGLIMIEIRDDGDKQYMIEANPRFWGPSQLFVDSGVNLFEAFIEDNGLTTDRPAADKFVEGVMYYWLGGIRQEEKEGNRLDYHNYDEKRHKQELADWLKSDVYNRADTKKIFLEETR